MKSQNKLAGQTILAVLFAVALSGCAGQVTQRSEPDDSGWVTREIFDEPPYEAFKEGYDTSTVDAQFVGPLRSVSKGVDVTVFFGGWCSDSKRHVPHFLKIADEAGISADHIRFYALDRTLKSKDGTTERYHIKKVPTFIFSRDGVEVGRITESPETTLEADMLAILVAGSKR